MKELVLRYARPAEDSMEGWERQSLPLGNGYMGANVFGRCDRERIQLTSNQLQNPLALGGTTSFADIFLELEHQSVTDYERGLDLDRGLAFCRYRAENTFYKREYFVSYPDNILALRLTADRPTLSFILSLSIPYLGDRAGSEGGKEGTVTAHGGVITMRGRLCARDLIFEGKAALVTDGEQTAGDGGSIKVKNATYAEIYYVQGTSYKLCPEVFSETDPAKKAFGQDPEAELTERLKRAVKKGYKALYDTHFTDYSELFSRVEIDLGGESGGNTDELLAEYKSSPDNRYLEELYFQFGRYLLISSSREGTTPASLQGVWSAYDKTPWSGGFWHNINIQMNYWPAFTANLAETFPAYVAYHKAYIPVAQKLASDFLKTNYPEGYTAGEGECGWLIPTACNSFEIGAEGSEMRHSGPGTVGMTSKLFWEYYDFTRDEDILKNITYPALSGAARFLTKCVKEYDDGVCRAAVSASPEQIVGNAWVANRSHGQFYYHTVGCAFDQQMIYENGKDFIKAAELLGKEDELYRLQKEQIDRYAPVRIGYSGQIKEYEEEHFYSEIGEPYHRHLSQLMSLMPGTAVGSSTPAWLDAAKKTLDLRGDISTGWALAHRLCAWARTGDGDRAYILFKKLLQTRTYDNLWDWHPPFQIDGNFGGVAGVAEMLMQSHEGYINILPTLPSAWHTGSFKGLKARGNFTVDCRWESGNAREIKITANAGGEVKLRYRGIGKAEVSCDGKVVTPVSQDDLFLSLITEKGKTYLINGLETMTPASAPTALSYKKQRGKADLCWEGEKDTVFRIYCAEDDAPDYTLLAETEETGFTYDLPDEKAVYNFRVTALYKDSPLSESAGALITVHPATELETDRYRHHMAQMMKYAPQ